MQKRDKNALMFTVVIIAIIFFMVSSASAAQAYPKKVLIDDASIQITCVAGYIMAVAIIDGKEIDIVQVYGKRNNYSGTVPKPIKCEDIKLYGTE